MLDLRLLLNQQLHQWVAKLHATHVPLMASLFLAFQIKQSHQSHGQ
jgi:hypothetical protein